MNLPLNPKSVAKAAIERGELRVGDELGVCVDDVEGCENRGCAFNGVGRCTRTGTAICYGYMEPLPKVKLPDPKTPKVDRRCGPRHKTYRKKGMVISLAQLRAERPHLYL